MLLFPKFTLFLIQQNNLLQLIFVGVQPFKNTVLCTVFLILDAVLCY